MNTIIVASLSFYFISLFHFHFFFEMDQPLEAPSLSLPFAWDQAGQGKKTVATKKMFVSCLQDLTRRLGREAMQSRNNPRFWGSFIRSQDRKYWVFFQISLKGAAAGADNLFVGWILVVRVFFLFLKFVCLACLVMQWCWLSFWNLIMGKELWFTLQSHGLSSIFSLLKNLPWQ